MIANPKEVPVEVLSGADVREKTVSIRRFIDPDAGWVGFTMFDGETVFARSFSARALVRWALDRGAFAVRSDYDLRLEK